MRLFVILLASYLLGSLPTAVLVAKRVAGINILEHGSGNPGASNVFRLIGPRWAIATFMVDVLKGYLPVWLTSKVAADLLHPLLAPTPIAVLGWVGFAAFLGHVYSPFLRFKGGKGAATGLGAMFAIAPHSVTTAIVIYGITLYLWKTFALATLIAGASIPVLLYFLEGDRHLPTALWGLLVPTLLLFTHRKNVLRLLQGGEHGMNEPMDKHEDE
ncbi:glycerol-3-phosphate 1-O-acyltransferase PlsY [bacterium]|nr:glycerol-3-phosphate 1-O-acyltransferase PlsY [bacterium]